MWFKPNRVHDEAIGDPPYLYRWHIFRKWKIKFLENIYLHNIVRSDDDRALHDHPWWNISIVLKGGYYEVMPCMPELYDVWRTTYKRWRGPGSIVFRSSTAIHRLELPAHAPHGTWTIFITGKKCREWGFFCPSGWVHWTKFDKKGCGA